MILQYETIYNRFLQKITDYSFLEYDEQYIYDAMNGWFHSMISKPRIRGKFSSISCDDEIMSLDFSLSNSVDEESDIEFVSEIFAMGMVIEWLEPQVKSVTNIAQMFGGKEQKYFSQAQHLKEIKDLLYETKIELQKTLRDYGYLHNSYIDR